jgi:CHAD domain-containing protein
VPTVLEVEDKYAVPEGFDLPDLTGVPGVATVAEPETVELSATYYDTPDHRLVRNRITLRRRTGGKDAGWHLKLPTTGGRSEVQRPLGRGRTVPKELAGLVLARTRGVPLAPVATLDTTRRITLLSDADGNVLAELADDEVRADVLDGGSVVEKRHWREVEVELVGGDRDLLAAVGHVLRRAGADIAPHGSKIALVLGARVAAPELPAVELGRKPSAADVVCAYLVEHLGAMLDADPRVRLDEPDAVHRMRVASRRLRSTLRSFRPVLDADRSRDLDARLKALAATLGAVRDAEVQLERLLAGIDALPEDLVLGPVRRRVEERLRGDRLRGQQELVAVLSGQDYLMLVEDLLEFVSDEPTPAGRRPARAVLPALVRKRYRTLAKRVAAARRAESTDRDVLLHQARKAGKRTRYAAEVLIPVSGRRAVALAKVVEDLQEVLGDHQDSVVARPLIRDLAIATNAARDESAFTFGLLHAREQSVAARSEARLDRVWRRTSRRSLRSFLG